MMMDAWVISLLASRASEEPTRDLAPPLMIVRYPGCCTGSSMTNADLLLRGGHRCVCDSDE